MPRTSKPRAGSLQFWPRKRADSVLPSVNWNALKIASKDGVKILGFLGYKVGMIRVLARDLTPHSMTKNKQIILPVSVVECPPMKILSMRFYKNNLVATEILSENLDKEVKKKLKLPKTPKKIEDIEKNLSNYDDMRIIVFSLVKKTSVKKTPDITEIALSGNLQDKFSFAKSLLGKEISISDVFPKNQIVDIRAVTRGKGNQGPVKRFGISLRQHKSEKGIRKAGSLGPWTPARLTFRAPLMGQMGFFTRVQYNSRILDVLNPNSGVNPKNGFTNYGMVKTECILFKGSVQGPSKRVVFITAPLRPGKKIEKQNFEIVSRLK